MTFIESQHILIPYGNCTFTGDFFSSGGNFLIFSEKVLTSPSLCANIRLVEQVAGIQPEQRAVLMS